MRGQSPRSSVRAPAEFRLELGEHLFDRVEVRAVGRQVDDLGLGLPDCLCDSGHLVARQVVHHHQVAGTQTRHQDLLDVGEEQLAVECSIDRHRRGQAGGSQGGHEGGDLLVLVRHCLDDPRAGRSPPVPAGHGGGGTGLVEEDQPVRIETGLPDSPGGAGRGYVRTVLFRRADRPFFPRQFQVGQCLPQRGDADSHAQVFAKFFQGAVGNLGHGHAELVGVTLAETDAAVSGRTRGGLSGCGPPLLETADPGFADAVLGGDCSGLHPIVAVSQNTLPQVQ